MRKTFGLMLASFIAMMTSACFASSIQVDTGRLIVLEGEIDSSVIAKGQDLIALSAASKKPIYVSINSVGGNVLAGLQFVDAMRVAQSRGVQVKCFVPNIAMSMAFYIFSECPERYAMKYSLLLFHPITVALMGSYNAADLMALSKDVTLLETPLINEMIRVTKLPRAYFMEHYKQQTIWTSENLLKKSPGFLTIVDDFGPITSFPEGAGQ